MLLGTVEINKLQLRPQGATRLVGNGDPSAFTKQYVRAMTRRGGQEKRSRGTFPILVMAEGGQEDCMGEGKDFSLWRVAGRERGRVGEEGDEQRCLRAPVKCFIKSETQEE